MSSRIEHPQPAQPPDAGHPLVSTLHATPRTTLTLCLYKTESNADTCDGKAHVATSDDDIPRRSIQTIGALARDQVQAARSGHLGFPHAMLHLAGYGVSTDDLRAFRQWGRITPGHLEHGETPGVDATTGPLGQGVANAVGTAIAEGMSSARLARLRATEGGESGRDTVHA